MLEIHVLQADATNITFHDNAKLALKAHEPKANIRREEMSKDSSKFKLKVFTTCNNGDEQSHIKNYILDGPKLGGVCVALTSIKALLEIIRTHLQKMPRGGCVSNIWFRNVII